MVALFKFRCYQCEKLLGAPPSKLGAVVSCPRCGVELIVPRPDDAEPPPEEPEGDAFRLEDLGLRLEPEPQSPPTSNPSAPDPIAFLERASDPEPDSEAEAEAEDEDEADSESSQAEPEIPPGLPEPPDPLGSPLVPGIRRRGTSPLTEPAARRRDVILPRTAAVAWSLFALLAMAFAFGAGLLAGHFLWR